MLYAIELSRLHATVNKPGELKSAEFHKILKRGTAERTSSRGRRSNLPTMRGLVEQLFRDCPQLPRGLSSYTVEEHIPLIQATYERLYPGKYRIIVFDNFGRYKPIYKGALRAEYDICIVHRGAEADGTAHFDGVRCVNTLFGKSYYCSSCEIAFTHKISHTGRCERKCRGCGGFGSAFPCRGGLKIKCSDCNGTFVSRECYERHFSTMCSRFKTCAQCGVCYDTKTLKRYSATKQHVCQQKFCLHCCTYHRAEQPCFIQRIVKKDEEDAPYRIVSYDFESSQNTQPEPNKDWFLHEVSVQLNLSN